MAKYTKEELIEGFMPIIAMAGTAKSIALEALKNKDKSGLVEARQLLLEAHGVHHKFVIAEADDDDNVVVELNLIIAHAEDQYMAAETIISLVEILLDVI
jgi:PTS system cellobiose-specific IIA component